MNLNLRPTLLSWLALLPILLLCAQPALAQTNAPENEPDTLILSDTLEYDDLKKQSIFTGNVVMTRGLMTLNADRLVMREDKQGFQHGTATVTGSPRVVIRQENPEKFEIIIARGLRAEYNGQTDEIDLIGQATVTKYVCGQPFDTISGERVKYNQRNSTYNASGGPQSAAAGGRVRSLATPSAKAEAAAAACKDAPKP
ncbi:lipopolysaccharide transport periplasmic protein LptA [Pusillimonas sp. CC-YST705]|uniref:Lipopolysaccharide export system protein LptA n=1 Tax=Mesopusillimonas faecipullorum TaxID=2755040 RepID=A0ABS8CCC5_9BURK|nr:lipopolysaccharide transport periplasmic protein LptA [Mesopusillimonas faecipullorum]MCB5363682.1 lipopolysaccharide transport periplasmic protein LptA [Mesopusillimonas faecipullorum]